MNGKKNLSPILLMALSNPAMHLAHVDQQDDPTPRELAEAYLSMQTLEHAIKEIIECLAVDVPKATRGERRYRCPHCWEIIPEDKRGHGSGTHYVDCERCKTPLVVFRMKVPDQNTGELLDASHTSIN